MLRQVIGMETGTVIGLRQAQAAVVLIGERHGALVHVIEYAKLHPFLRCRLPAIGRADAA